MTDRRSPIQFARANWQWLTPVVVVGAVLVGWLAIGFFGIHTLFFDDEVNEDVPVFASGIGTSGLASDAIDAEMADDMNAAAVELEMTSQVEATDEMPDMVQEIATLQEGTFVGRSHPAEGRAVVLNDGSEQRFLRFEDFETDNGPDLNVYLTRADADAPAGDFGRSGDFVDLGDLKGNVGPQNYEIPPDIDLGEFDTVVIWCVRFGVAFGAADLA